jgi:hypothetical protein
LGELCVRMREESELRLRCEKLQSTVSPLAALRVRSNNERVGTTTKRGRLFFSFFLFPCDLLSPQGGYSSSLSTLTLSSEGESGWILTD